MPAFNGPGGFESFDDFLARVFGAGGPSSRGGNFGRPRRIDITQLLSRQAQQLLSHAARHATEQGHGELDALHLLWAATQHDPGRGMLSNAGADPDAIARAVTERLPQPRADAAAGGEQPPSLTTAAKQVLIDAYQVAQAFGATYIDPEHVLLALAANQELASGRLLAEAGMTPEALQTGRGDGDGSGGGAGRSGGRGSGTPTLDSFGDDLTERARNGELDTVIGRELEIDQTLEVLSRRTKNNPVLVGEAGVGKTAIVEGIAQRIVAGDVPELLLGKRLVQLNLSGMLAGTRYRGDFEERMKKVLDEITEHSDELIVFIDEVHTVVGAGGAEGAVDAGNMLKPKLARGELHIVGATTLDEYRKNIEKDPALERRFQPVTVDEPAAEDAVAILHGLREAYQDHHKVTYTDDAIAAAVELSARYLPDRKLPDKAIDLLDQAGARLRLRRSTGTDREALQQRLAELTRQKDGAVAEEDYERASALRDQIADLQRRIDGAGAEAGQEAAPAAVVTAEEIAGVVSRLTGIPASTLSEQEKQRLQRLESDLHRRVIGQDDAVRAVARAVRRNRTGMGDPDRPVGNFLFLGPTGVGKTELAKALAATLFGDESNMIRLDMSEYGERHTVSRLVGAPPGYVGYDEAGQLTEQVRRRPYSVILLDEIEKAHPDVFNILLQVLDDGRLTDGQGRTVNFRNTVLIMTSNLGSELISSRGGGLGFSTPAQQHAEKPVRDRLMGKLRENFRPEFLNRIDEVVVFERLASDQLRRIADLLLTDSRDRLAAQDIAVEFTPEAVDWIAEHGYQPEFGARPLRRTIQREVDDRIADLLLDDAIGAGARLRITPDGERLAFEVTEPAHAG